LVVLLILIFWFFTQNHLITNILVQGILVIAYFPVISRMISSGENNESYLIWGGMLLTAVLALLSTEGGLAIIYTVRAVISIILLMGLMFWVDRKKTSG